MAVHTIMGGKVKIYKRPNTPYWQCSTFLNGKKRRASTKEVSLSLAKDFAEDWYLVLRGKHHRGELKSEKIFSFAAKQFTREYDIITQGQRSEKWVKGHHDRLRLHLLPFFGELGLSEVSAGKVQDYRIHRMENTESGRPPARSTLHDETVTLRQVLKTAMRHGWLKHLPDLSSPYNSQTKISHRAWFTAKEYKQLYEATRRRANKPKNPRFKWNAEQLHDYVLFMANTGLRPDEAKLLQFRDVEIVHDESTDEIILEIEVRGKRGVGFCKSMNGAVRPFERLVERLRLVVDEEDGTEDCDEAEPQLAKAHPNDLVFPGNPIKMFNNILTEEKLKFDRDEQRRTAYSLRHTYICLRLMEGADIYQIAKNCRTSVEMIEKYYASHIKTSLDAAAINVRRKKKIK